MAEKRTLLIGGVEKNVTPEKDNKLDNYHNKW